MKRFGIVVVAIMGLLAGGVLAAEKDAAARKKAAARAKAARAKAARVRKRKPAPPATAPATRPAMSEAERLRRVKLLTEHYSRDYAKHLSSKDWFVRSLAVVALARLDSPETTKSLMETLTKDVDPLVRLCAWEALHARTKSLTPREHQTWTEAGIDLAIRRKMPGNFRASMLRSLVSYGPGGFGGKAKRVFLQCYEQCHHTQPWDVRTLVALREVLAVWRDPGLIRMMAANLTRPGHGNKAEYVLGGLTDEIAAVGSGDADAKTSRADWTKVKSDWMAWLKDHPPQPPAKGSVQPYHGLSSFLPPAEKIVDPRDEKWQRDLELEDLRVRDFDLCFCIDATGSMLAPMQWVGRSVAGMLRVFRLVCREPRIGLVLYRHEVVPALMKPCCKTLDKPSKKGAVFRTVYSPLTDNVAPLAGKLLSLDPRSGAYLHPGGAVHGGLTTALTKLHWKKSEGAKKIITLIGDSPVTPGNEKAACDLAAAAHKRGWIIHAVTLKKLPTYDAVAKAGGGVALLIPFHKAGRPGKAKGKAAGGGKAGKRKAAAAGKGRAAGKGAGPVVPAGKRVKIPAAKQLAAPPAADSPFSRLVVQIIRSMLPPGYHNRVDPLVGILLEYATAPPPK